MRRCLFLIVACFLLVTSNASAATVEAEDMNQPSGSEVQNPLGWASGDAYVSLHEQGSLTTQVTLPSTDRIHISAREGFDCGDVSMNVRVDGSFVFSVSVDGIPFGLYTVPLILSQGSHSLEIEFPQDTDERCDTTLRVDAASFREASPPSFKPDFDPRVVFNQPVPASKRTTTNAQMGTNIVAGIRGDTPPLNIAPPGTPNRTAVLGSNTVQFPIPQGITFGTGTDFPTIVRDPVQQRELRCWRGTFDGSTMRCQGGGLFIYANDGRTGPDGQLALGQAYLGGGAGNGLTYSAGMFSMADFLNGGPQHAIRIASGCVSSEVWPPARKSDQNDSGCPPMGSFALIPLSFDCSTLTSGTSDPDDTTYVRQLCIAGQTYGFMRADGTGADVVVYHEGEATANWMDRLTGCNDSLGCLARRLPWSQMTLASRPASHTAW